MLELNSKSSPRKRLVWLREHINFPRPRAKGNELRVTPEETEKLAKQLGKILKREFKSAGLDHNNVDHWLLLLLYYVLAMHRRRGPGQPKKWTKPRRKQLWENVNKMRAQNRNLSEAQCCNYLSRKPQYLGVASATLRRVLQTAKKEFE